LKKYPYEISGGQKQRTAAARAIVNRPTLVLADEPTGALDSKSSAELLQALSDLNEKNGATIMLVTHDAFAASYCKRIIFIKDGLLFTELARGGTRKEFFQKILDVLKTLGGGLTDM
jgi:putative ABC transport system ATP-binding protein